MLEAAVARQVRQKNKNLLRNEFSTRLLDRRNRLTFQSSRVFAQFLIAWNVRRNVFVSRSDFRINFLKKVELT